MSEWQPIDTAPKGKPVLVAIKDEVTIAEQDDSGCWFLVEDGEFFVWVMPTHWMPLPDPPQS